MQFKDRQLVKDRLHGIAGYGGQNYTVRSGRRSNGKHGRATSIHNEASDADVTQGRFYIPDNSTYTFIRHRIAIVACIAVPNKHCTDGYLLQYKHSVCVHKAVKFITSPYRLALYLLFKAQAKSG